MPDITMCGGYACTRRNECFRHRAKADPYWQSWFAESPLRPDGTCGMFKEIWPAREDGSRMCELRDPT